MATVTLRSLLELNDYSEMVVSLQNGINRTKIDTAVNDAGFAVPLPNKVSFNYINSASDIFIVTWFPIAGQYGYKKLTLV